MSIRLAAARQFTLLALALAAILSVGAGGTARADWNPFESFYSNVARAAAQNDAAAVRRIVGTGESPNQTDEQDRTGLIVCGMNGNLQIAAILIKAGAKLNQKDKLGNTPLHYAAERDQVDMARLLLEAGAAVDPENKSGMTPLMVAASRGNADIVRALLSQGASPRKADYTGRDAVGWAGESHRPAIVQMLRRAADGHS